MNTKTLTTHLKAALSALEDAPWYDPSETQKDAFCAKTGFPREYADGWPGAPTPNEPKTWQGYIPALPVDASDAALMEYHGMGFTRDGHRASWTALMLSSARRKCYDLELATTPAEQDSIAGPGASNLPTPIVRMLLLGQSADPSAYYGPLRNNPTIANAASYCCGTLFPSTSGTTTGGTPTGPGV
jgi:hypothetical protein